MSIQYLSRAAAKKLRGTALLRLDFNTEDEWRMEAALPTLRLLLRRAEKVVIVSHRGRPQSMHPALSLRKDASHLSRLFQRKVVFIPHFRFADIKRQIAAAPRGSLFVLENIRFLHGESTPVPELAQRLASLADYYVNDAFAVDHHPADSVNLVNKFLPGYAGLELEKEIKILGGAMSKPKRPLLLVVGGGKAHDKLGVLRRFEKKADKILLGGAAGNTLLKLKGVDVNGSLVDEEKKDYPFLRRFLRGRKAVLPVDWRAEKGAILDIGPKTEKLFAAHIHRARTIVWSGPLGFIEKKKFESGSLALAKAITGNRRAFSITGGGETVAFLRKHKLHKKFGFISTGGGAMLQFLAGEKLPGIAALEKGEPRPAAGRGTHKKSKRN